ncbi:ribonuclease T2-like protein [Phycomyces nitens]|nr:ribonuclease T2-like protein [Phycomyces nitens]
MKSVFSFSLLFAAASLVSAGPVLNARDSCPINTLSCSTTNVDTCCSPKYGLVLLVQQWVKKYGPSDAFTLHGLWPDTCSGGQTGSSGCDSSRTYSNVGTILESGNPTLYSSMNTYWPSYNDDNNVFWTHEWGKHGTCVTTLAPACFGNDYTKYDDMYGYFNKVLSLRKEYDLYKIFSNAGITPGGTYTVAAMSSAIEKALGVSAKITCSSGNLSEIWLYFYVKGTSDYVLTDSIASSCSGSVYYPKKY